MKHFLLVTFSAIFLAACSSNTDKTEDATTDTTAAPVSTITGDNSMNSLDWAGVYKGTVPCADCEGIETTITIANDSSYVLSLNYLGKKGAAPIEKKGTFSWNAAGNTITLNGITDGANQYLVGENRLIQLDLNGERINGDLAKKYELGKQ